MSVSLLIGLEKIVSKYLPDSASKPMKVYAALLQSQDEKIDYIFVKNLTGLSSVELTRAIKNLSDKELVDTFIGEEDTRKKYLCLTDKGKAFKLELIEEVANGS
tara:strand:- start:493 stop:804 length:312 start_codon:yes stop_codon:yes gene_type:complete